MNAAFAASNMVNQPQRPEGLLILRLRGLFLCGVLLCSRGSAEAEEASTASTAPIMECCKRTALSRPGRTTTLVPPQIGSHHGTLRCDKNHAGVTKNRRESSTRPGGWKCAKKKNRGLC